jgi:hypothetical protein
LLGSYTALPVVRTATVIHPIDVPVFENPVVAARIAFPGLIEIESDLSRGRLIEPLLDAALLFNEVVVDEEFEPRADVE